jgi:hypothetical protein
LKRYGAAAMVELAGVIMRLWPSGLARARSPVAMAPLAPGLFSTITGFPASLASLSL